MKRLCVAFLSSLLLIFSLAGCANMLNNATGYSSGTTKSKSAFSSVDIYQLGESGFYYVTWTKKAFKSDDNVRIEIGTGYDSNFIIKDSFSGSEGYYVFEDKDIYSSIRMSYNGSGYSDVVGISSAKLVGRYLYYNDDTYGKKQFYWDDISIDDKKGVEKLYIQDKKQNAKYYFESIKSVDSDETSCYIYDYFNDYDAPFYLWIKIGNKYYCLGRFSYS